MERWLPVVGFEGLYEVSNLGRVKRVADSRNGQKAGNCLRPRPAKGSGYLQVCLSKDGKDCWRYLHVVVCTALQGPRPDPKMKCCHGDGVRANCRNDNLRWDTKAANEADRVLHGTTNRGERHGLAKLKNADVIDIKAKLGAGVSQRKLAKAYSVSTACIADMQHGGRWANINAA